MFRFFKKEKLIFLIFIFNIFLLLSVNTFATTKLVILGDSLTEGYGVATEKAFPALLQDKFKKEKSELVIIAAGSSGSTSASGVSRMKWILKDKPQFVLILLGSNDGLRGLKIEETEKNLKETIGLALKNNVNVALGQLMVPPNYGKDYGLKFSNLFIKIAKEKKIQLAPFLLNRVAGKANLNLADGIHPNEKGHEIVAENLFGFIKKWTQK